MAVLRLAVGALGPHDGVRPAAGAFELRADYQPLGQQSAAVTAPDFVIFLLHGVLLCCAPCNIRIPCAGLPPRHDRRILRMASRTPCGAVVRCLYTASVGALPRPRHCQIPFSLFDCQKTVCAAPYITEQKYSDRLMPRISRMSGHAGSMCSTTMSSALPYDAKSLQPSTRIQRRLR